MSSPSQPFNNSAFAPAVAVASSPMALDAPSSSPSGSTALSALLPQIASSTSGLGLTPGTNPFLALQAQAPSGAGAGVSAGGSGAGAGGFGGAGGGYGGAAPASVRSANTSHVGADAVGVEGSLRGLEEAGRMVDRAQQVRAQLDQAKRTVFRQEGGEGEGQAAVPSNIESLQLEYNQLITALYLLSSTTLFGALPVDLPLSPPPDGGSTVAELTGWCESRAALEFSRREGVKSAAKVVLDVFKGQAR